jgi:outer membrane protein
MNQKISTALNLVLVAAVAVLFYLHFKKPSVSSNTDGTVSGSVYYINTDSVISSYQFTRDNGMLLEAQNAKRTEMLQNRQRTYESMVKQYQKDLPVLTEREKAKKEEQIMRVQNELMQMQQQFQQDAMMEEQGLLVTIADTLEAFMTDYVKGKNIDYVLGYQENGMIFYRNPKFDLTNDVITGLNARYKPATTPMAPQPTTPGPVN